MVYMTVYIHVNTYHRCAIIYLFNFIYLCQKNAVVLYLRVFDLLYIYMHELINGYDMENKICFFHSATEVCSFKIFDMEFENILITRKPQKQHTF